MQNNFIKRIGIEKLVNYELGVTFTEKLINNKRGNI